MSAKIDIINLNGVNYQIGGVGEVGADISVKYKDGTLMLITKQEKQAYDYDGRELSEYTWADLKQMCTDNNFKDIRVGDYKTITLSDGEIVVMQIAGINTYYNTTPSLISYHIDWISKDCLKDYVQWNTTNTNNGNTDNHNPYLVSNVYQYLNNIIYPKLPDDVKSVIANKISLLADRYSSDGLLIDDSNWNWRYMGNLWLPNEYEVFGSVIWGTKGWSQGQAVQYPLFANSWKHRIKCKGNNGDQCAWWLATVASGQSTQCTLVNTTGYADYYKATQQSINVPVCFRITA